MLGRDASGRIQFLMQTRFRPGLVSSNLITWNAKPFLEKGMLTILIKKALTLYNVWDIVKVVFG